MTPMGQSLQNCDVRDESANPSITDMITQHQRTLKAFTVAVRLAR